MVKQTTPISKLEAKKYLMPKGSKSYTKIEKQKKKKKWEEADIKISPWTPSQSRRWSSGTREEPLGVKKMISPWTPSHSRRGLGGTREEPLGVKKIPTQNKVAKNYVYVVIDLDMYKLFSLLNYFYKINLGFFKSIIIFILFNFLL